MTFTWHVFMCSGISAQNSIYASGNKIEKQTNSLCECYPVFGFYNFFKRFIMGIVHRVRLKPLLHSPKTTTIFFGHWRRTGIHFNHRCKVTNNTETILRSACYSHITFLSSFSSKRLWLDSKAGTGIISRTRAHGSPYHLGQYCTWHGFG